MSCFFQSLANLREKTALYSGAYLNEPSIQRVIGARELGTRGGPRISRPGRAILSDRNEPFAFNSSEKAYLVNKLVLFFQLLDYASAENVFTKVVFLVARGCHLRKFCFCCIS